MHVRIDYKTYICTKRQSHYKGNIRFSLGIKKISLIKRKKQVKEIGYGDYRQCTLFLFLKRNLTILITSQMSIIIV